ncbi:unnamed protein product, partial [marine sediment metagenome]
MSKPFTRKYSNEFKHKVALAAIKGDKTVSELVQEFRIGANQIYLWKKQLEKEGLKIFSGKTEVDI